MSDVLPVSIIPVTLPHYTAIFVVLHKEQKEKIESGDRVTISGQDLAAYSPTLGCTHLHDLRILLCYEEDAEAFTKWIVDHAAKPIEIMKYITRNWPDRAAAEATVAAKGISSKSFLAPGNGASN